MNSKSFFALSAAAAVAGMGLCAKFAAFGAPMGLAEIAAALVFLGASFRAP